MEGRGEFGPAIREVETWSRRPKGNVDEVSTKKGGGG